MVAEDEAALICDFAETYGVLDYRELPARRAALLACGLGDGSRIRMRLSGAPAPPEIMLLALIADALQILVWQNTKDGHRNRNRPPSVLAALTGETTGAEGDGFDSAEEFDTWRASMIGR